MNADLATTLITANKGSDIEIVLVNGDSVYGTAFSVNSKGVNVKDDEGKTRSVGLARIDHIDVLPENHTFGADDDADDLAATDLLDVVTEASEDLADEIGFMDKDEDTADEATAELEDIYAMLHDGMSTAELAAVLSDHLSTALTPKELRVHLRALGLGVGKGRKYSLSASEFRSVRNLIATTN